MNSVPPHSLVFGRGKGTDDTESLLLFGLPDSIFDGGNQSTTI